MNWVEELEAEVLAQPGTWTGKRAMDHLHSIGFNCTIQRARVCVEKIALRVPSRVAVTEGRRWVWEVAPEVRIVDQD